MVGADLKVIWEMSVYPRAGWLVVLKSLAVIFVVILTMPAIARGDGAGGGGGNGNGNGIERAARNLFPDRTPEVVAQVAEMIREIMSRELEEIVVYELSESPCSVLKCRFMNDEAMTKIISVARTMKQRRERDRINMILAIVGGITAFAALGSLILGLVNLRRSRRHERVLKRLQQFEASRAQATIATEPSEGV